MQIDDKEKLSLLKNQLLQYSNSYLNVIALVRQDISSTKYDMISNYYKSLVLSVKNLMDDCTENKAQISLNKVRLLFSELMLMRFTVEKYDTQFEDFKQNSRQLTETLKMFIKS